LTRIRLVTKTMMAGREASRRRAPRLAIERDGSLSGRHPRPVKVLDLSGSGCLVRCDASLDPGAIFDLQLRLEPESLTAKVRVTNSCLDGDVAAGEPSRYLAGLEFLSLSAREQAALRRFLEDERRRRRSADAAAL
jgi:PilZ domain-containing protein